jgi:hypothetical protein
MYKANPKPKTTTTALVPWLVQCSRLGLRVGVRGGQWPNVATKSVDHGGILSRLTLMSSVDARLSGSSPGAILHIELAFLLQD